LNLRQVIQPASRAVNHMTIAVRPILIAASHASASRRAVALGLRASEEARRLLLQAMRGMSRRWPLLARLLGLTADPARGSAAANGQRVRAPHARPDAATTEALIAALRDQRAETAVDAADALQRHPPELAVPALREVLHNRDGYFSPSTRAAAVRALGVLLPPSEGEAFAVAASDVDASVSVAAIGALVERHDEMSVDVLLRVLEDRTGFYVPIARHAAARGLALLGRGQPERVNAILQNESDGVVREALVSLVS
jgi:HEAT repeat protein